MIVRILWSKIMKSLSRGRLSLRRTVIVTVALPLVISLAVMAYAWPASRIEPRDLPVGIVGTSTASQNAIEGLTHSRPGGFDFHLYPDQASARSAIKNREIYGAFAITARNVTVLEASAASATVAQILTTAGQQLGSHAGTSPTPAAGTSHRSTPGKNLATPAPKARVRTVDVVPTSADDPRGVVFNSALLPLTMCSILLAAFIAMSGARMPVYRRIADLAIACVAVSLAAYFVAQGVLGALPHEHVATWGSLALMMFAISATAVGLITLVGSAGLGISAALMVFVGNPFSGSTSAPELLPKAVNDIGQWLPPGAGANLLRSTAYFDGNGSAGHIAVLILWSLLGLAAIALGRRRTPAVANESRAEALASADGTKEAPSAVDESATALSPSPLGRPHSHAQHAAHG
ncbi:ABC transporter permease [Streptomyces fagopyri]|uniref:ABC transporter permease n=1 Tax=Streptomyces fagopyri TaxID=2662397 RepID=UPI001885A8C5|nr:ABC transporter permease [Streptomyces fagopyri]